MKINLIWKHYLVLISIILVGLLIISKNVGNIIRHSYENEKKTALEQVAKTSVSLFTPSIENNDLVGIQRICRQINSETGLRVTVIDTQGKVLGDSNEDPEQMENHFDRPEFQTALTGQAGSHIRPSDTLGIEMMYVAVPVKANDQLVAVLRTSVAMSQLRSIMDLMFGQMIRYGLATTLVFVATGFIFTLVFNHHMVSLRKGAERFAHGDFNHRLDVSKIPDVAEVAESMNIMAAQLDQRIRTITAQKNEQQAMLSSMVEGIIAVDNNGYILSINNAAAEMLQTSTDVTGRTVEEVIRNKHLQSFVKSTIDSEDTVESQVTLHEKNHTEQHIQAHGSILKNEQDQKIGALIVLNDITHIRQLEQVRRDFVANVSHELKTPVTSIKGFIETLLDGAINNEADTRRFLEIIIRQTNRLDSIIEDLLMLSRIEQYGEKEKVSLEPVKIRPILVAAASLCAIKASKKQINVEINCDGEIIATVNASLLEQAIVNLVDNAIKYSEPNNHIRLEATQDNKTTCIRVCDNGCGIPKEHLPRLFERFYRVDKARSRKLGGTGLGLAIVKHIAQTHKGTVKAESTVGQGSTFSIKIPT